MFDKFSEKSTSLTVTENTKNSGNNSNGDMRENQKEKRDFTESLQTWSLDKILQ